MITTFYPPYNFGGDGIGIERFSHGLVRRGHQVTVVHDADSFTALSAGKSPKVPEQPDGLEIVSLRSRWGSLASLVTQQTGRPLVHRRTLQRLLQQGQFDVINYHNVSLVGGPGVLSYGGGLKLYMAHEHWLVCPSHVLWRHGKERCTGRECLRCVLHYRRPPQYWRYSGYLNRQLGHLDACIAMSEFSRRKHREFGLPIDMEVVPYFLPDPEPEELDQAPSNAGSSPHARPYFLFVGRLEKIKGLDDVIPVFRDYPEADLLIAGDGEYGATLRRAAQGNDRVHFLGRVDQDKLAAYYQHAVALIVPSVCFETFGIILIESFRQRTPVIARRLGPFPEIVEKAQAGELFESSEELVAAMRRLQTDPAKRAELGTRAFQAYVDHWSESAVIPQYLGVVRRAAERSGRQEVLDKLGAGALV
jgi:glycosyltransferase involved in cell wall biosynthesis